jgi:heme-degrading monooxygenase HmoA
MSETKRGLVAVIFISRRNQQDEHGYSAAALAMVEEAARQPGYAGIDSVRDENGFGITISYWQDEASAVAWRNHAGHSAIRDQGRASWYSEYEVMVAQITRDYRWRSDTDG